MVYLINKKNILFDEKETFKIFKMNEKYLKCPFSFDEMIKNDCFFSCLNDLGQTIGLCYFLMDTVDGRKYPFYSGAFKRKKHFEALQSHKILINLMFKKYDKIYTWTPFRHAQIFNKMAGMKQDKNNKNLFYIER